MGASEYTCNRRGKCIWQWANEVSAKPREAVTAVAWLGNWLHATPAGTNSLKLPWASEKVVYCCVINRSSFPSTWRIWTGRRSFLRTQESSGSKTCQRKRFYNPLLVVTCSLGLLPLFSKVLSHIPHSLSMWVWEIGMQIKSAFSVTL